MLKINSDLFYVKNKDTYPPFKNGLYLEEYFLEYMLKFGRTHDNYGRRYIPVLWTNVQLELWFYEKEKKDELQKLLNEFIISNPCKRGYFTIVQFDDGPKLDLPENTLIYGACSGTLPLPLIYEDTTNQLESIVKKSFSEKNILCSFVGTFTHTVRIFIGQLFSNNPHFFISNSGNWTQTVSQNNQSMFINTTLNSKFTLAPRGYGRSSFRFFEIFQLGTIPIYVWDDIEWLPYKDKIDYSTFCISIHVNDLPNLESILLGIDETRYNEMMNAYKKVAYCFRLEYMCEYVLQNRIVPSASIPETVIHPSIDDAKSEIDVKISLCIPTMNRFDTFLSANLDKYIQYLNDGLIDEIVICDETDDDYYKIYMKYGYFINNNESKIKVFKNKQVLGVFLNKLKVCSLANHKYIALIDSDNFADDTYFISAKNYIKSHSLPEHFILAPSFARPLFDYRNCLGSVKTTNLCDFLNRDRFHICLNTGNYILSNSILSTIQYDSQLLLNVSSCDVVYFNLLCFIQFRDFEMHIVDGMEYNHAVHDDSTQTKHHHVGDYYLNNIIIPTYYQIANQAFTPKSESPSSQIDLNEKMCNTNNNIDKMPMYEKLKMPFYSLGNKIIDYFSKVGIAFACGNDFIYELPYYLQHKNDIFLLNKFPDKIFINDDIRNRFKTIQIQRVIGEKYEFVGDYANLWEITNNDRVHFWNCIKPIANQLINSVLPSYSIQNKLKAHPIIHFRCSDVPFIRHGFYHFQKYRYFLDSLNELAQKGVDITTVYLMFSLNHECPPENKAAATIYIEALKQFLKKQGFSVEIVSQDPISDFTALFYAPAVISTCSSFSFTSGFFGNGIFITEGHYNEDEFGIIRECPCYAPFIKKGYSLNHSMVPDYFDTDAVIKLLQS